MSDSKQRPEKWLIGVFIAFFAVFTAGVGITLGIVSSSVSRNSADVKTVSDSVSKLTSAMERDHDIVMRLLDRQLSQVRSQ